MHNRKALNRWLKLALGLAIIAGSACSDPVEPPGPPKPQTITLLVTPKAIRDFDNPDSSVVRFLEHYEPLLSRASGIVVIFAVGNSDHILNYRGRASWANRIDWARTTDARPVSDRSLDYHRVDRIVRSLRHHAGTAGHEIEVFEHIDSGGEFTLTNDFKYLEHPECTANKWGMFDIRGRLHADARTFASAPGGIAEGKLCGEFLADQVATYLRDLDFDGVLFDNQLGTRGRWRPDDGPGHSAQEEAAIRAFLAYTRNALAGKQLMWFDSYNPVDVEREVFSFPADGYAFFDYLIASGFCAVTAGQYQANLFSKLDITGGPRILATLDYVDPWYTYNSYVSHAACSRELEDVAVERRDEIDGVMFFANDEAGNFVPRGFIQAFASRLFGDS